MGIEIDKMQEHWNTNGVKVETKNKCGQNITLQLRKKNYIAHIISQWNKKEKKKKTLTNKQKR